MKLTVEKLITGGKGLARKDGKTYFVEGVLDGEEVLVNVTADKKKYANASAKEILSPSPYRVKPLCKYHFTCELKENELYCGGCSWQHIDYSYQLELKKKILLENLKRIGGFDHPKEINVVKSVQQFRYRNKALIPVSEKDGSAISGFYMPGSHNIVVLDDCLTQPQIVFEISSYITKNLPAFSIRPYEEKTHKGSLRHIFIRTSRTGDVLVGFIAKKYESVYVTLAQEILKAFPQVKGVILNENPDKTNIITGKDWRNLAGNAFLIEKLALTGLELKISYGAFFQINTFIADKLYLSVADRLATGNYLRIYDLYSGVSGFGIAVSKLSKEIVAVEESEQAVMDGVANAKFNNVENIRCFATKTEKYLKKVKSMKDDAAIIDPPRSGLSKEVIKSLIQLKPSTIAYISCDTATFCRDAKALLTNGYKLSSIEAFDMFPQTSHLEVLGIFQNQPTNLI